MQFDFTSIMDRHGKDSIAVDHAPGHPDDGFDAIPMWVADMNFPVVPTIQAAIAKRLEHPAFGYFAPTDAYYDSIIQWHSKRHGVKDLTKEDIGYENGVLGGVVSAAQVLCSPGDRILVHSPTYIGFTHALEGAGFRLECSPLVKDKDGIWRMDLVDMERRIVKYHIHTAVFCSPHNPCGRVWEREEIEAMMALYEKYDVYVISDEIWSDLILFGNHHIPTQSVNAYAREHTCAFYAPSKTFNLAGLVGSYHIIYNKWLRERIEKQSLNCHYNAMNVLSMHALIGAYQPEGYAWVDALCEVLSGNVMYACDYIQKHFLGVEVSRPQGTYMLFLNCEKWCEEHHCTLDDVLQKGWKVGVIWQDGRPFHGTCCIRMNLALPLSRVEEAFARLDKYVFC